MFGINDGINLKGYCRHYYKYTLMIPSQNTVCGAGRLVAWPLVELVATLLPGKKVNFGQFSKSLDYIQWQCFIFFIQRLRFLNFAFYNIRYMLLERRCYGNEIRQRKHLVRMIVRAVNKKTNANCDCDGTQTPVSCTKVRHVTCPSTTPTTCTFLLAT